MTTHTGTFAPTADGRGVIALDDAPDLPDGRRVRVIVEPHPDSTAAPAAPTPRPGSLAHDATAARAALEQVFGVLRDHPAEVDAFNDETRRLRQMTREEARAPREEG
jgi:hypothetical protein